MNKSKKFRTETYESGSGELESDPKNELKKVQKIPALIGGMGRYFNGTYTEYTVLPRSVIHAVTIDPP